jgi:putative ABC transport system permease protein
VSGRFIGDQSRLPVSIVISLRSLLLQRPVSTGLTILAVASSVALAASVEMTSRSVRGALEITAESLVGSAVIEVAAGEMGVPEALIDRVRSLPGVRSASPIIEHTFRVEGGSLDGFAVRVLGIDLLYEHEVRSYHIEQGGFTVRDPLRLVAVPGSLMVAGALADRLALDEGDSLALRSAHGSRVFTLRGVLAGGLSSAFGGQIAVADIFGLQDVLGMGRTIERLDVSIERGESIGEMVAQIQRAVGTAASVRGSTVRASMLDQVIGALEMAIWMIALIGILLSLAMTFAVISLSVERRTEEFALLRAAGMSGRAVSGLILFEAFLVSAPATLLGLLASAAGADRLIQTFSRTSSYLEHVVIEPTAVEPSTLLLGIAVGIPVALLAAGWPAMLAGTRRPLDVLMDSRSSPAWPRVSPRSLGAAGVLACCAGLAFVWPAPEWPGARLLVLVGASVGALGIGSGQLLLALFPRIQALLGSIVPRVGYLVGATMLERPLETSATITVWAAIVAGVVAGLSLIHSVGSTIDDFWVSLNGSDVVMAFGQDPLASHDRELIRQDAIETMRDTRGVLGVAPYYGVEVLLSGQEVLVEAFATEAYRSHGDLAALSSSPREVSEALLRGEAAVNRGFVERFGLDVGDTLVLPTANGPASFRIGAHARDFSGRAGTIRLDESTFRRFFHPPGAAQVALWIEPPRQRVLESLQRAVPQQALFFRQGEEFTRHTRQVLGRFDDLLALPVTLIGSIGVVALLNLLLGSVVARTRDLAVLRAAGGTPANLRSVLLLNGVMIGVVATGFGMLLTQLWSAVLTDTVGSSLGYDVAYYPDWFGAARVAACAIALSTVAGCLPLVKGTRSPVAGMARIG